MSRPGRYLPLALLLLLGGCSLSGMQPQPQAPQTAPRQAQNHPHFAPPPGGNSYWDNGLSVYVVKSQPDLYYRERTYYRWRDGWHWASSPHGPWLLTDSSGVPAGLGRKYAR